MFTGTTVSAQPKAPMDNRAVWRHRFRGRMRIAGFNRLRRRQFQSVTTAGANSTTISFGEPALKPGHRL